MSMFQFFILTPYLLHLSESGELLLYDFHCKSIIKSAFGHAFCGDGYIKPIISIRD